MSFRFDQANKKKSVICTLNHWALILSSAGYFCEVRPIVQSDLLESKPPNFVLIVEQLSNVQFSREIGPFQSARLIIYPDGEWRLDSPILEHQKVAEGRLSCPVDTAELVNIAQKWLSKTHVLCPGLVGLDGHDLQKELGYFPKNVRMLNSKSLYSKRTGLFSQKREDVEQQIIVLQKLQNMACPWR